MKTKSLKKIFLYYTIFTIIAISIIIGLSYGICSYKKASKIFQKTIVENLNNSTPFIENYLWQLDYDDLNIISNVIFNSNKSICNLTILNEKNKKIFQKIKKNEYCEKKYLINNEKNIFHNKKYLGKIVISFSNKFLKEKFKSIILLNLLTSLLIALIIIFIFITLFNNLIEKNLLKINENLEKIANGDYNITFVESGIKDFDNIIKTLNFMINEIKVRDIKTKELTNKLETIIESLPVAIFILDEKGNYIQINNTVCKMLNMSKDEILSKKIPEYSEESFTLDYGLNALKNVIENGEHEFEWKLKSKAGKIIHTIAKGVKVTFGIETWLIFVLTDVTYLKKLEQEIIKKEKLESVGLLAGGIAHDFNNILTSMIGSLELMQIYLEKKELTKAKEKLQGLMKIINRAKTLTYQLLTFSKGGAPIRKTVENLPQLIKDTVEFLLSGTAIEVKYDFDKDLKPVKIDPEQISLVIENIILNAKDALNNQGKMEIKAINSLDYVKISIKDYGSGIPDDIKDKIWEPYFTTKEKGSGLGLTTVYSIIKKHEGYIKIFSEKGKYTDFQIFLPVSKDAIEKESAKDILSLKQQISKLKILVLEDEEDVQDLMYDLLKILGHEPVIVKTGEEAIEKVKNENFDLALLDLTIKGGMGGKDCIKELRKINPDIKAIVYSGYSESEIMKDYQKYGFDAVLKKPFTLNELKEAIESCFYS